MANSPSLIPYPLPTSPMSRALGAGKTWGFIGFGWVDHGTRPSTAWGTQNRFALNYLVRGSGTFVDSQGKTRALAPGSIYHHFTGSKARLTLHPDSGCVEFYLVFDPDTEEGLYKLQMIPEQEVLTTGNNQLAIDAFSRFYDLCTKPAREANRRQILAGLVDFLSFLYDLTIEGATLSRWHEIVHAAAQELETNFEKKIHLPDMARSYKVSYASFRREFKKIVGVSPAEFRIKQRIETSCGLLSRYTVKEVAEQLGYCDPFTFSSQFKAFTGLSPSQFRQNAHR